MDTDLSLRIENVIGGLRNYGYRVACHPVPGSEQEYYEDLRDGLNKVEAEVDHLHRHARCRGKSKRTLRFLHRNLPEPCWGVSAPAERK